MKTVCKTIRLEQRSSNLWEAQSNQTVRKMIKLFFNWACLRFSLKSSFEELDKWGKRELIHVIDLYQISNDHEKIRTNIGESPINISLLIKRKLKFFGLLKSSFDLGALLFSLIQRINEGFIFKNITLWVSELIQ